MFLGGGTDSCIKLYAILIRHTVYAKMANILLVMFKAINSEI